MFDCGAPKVSRLENGVAVEIFRSLISVKLNMLEANTGPILLLLPVVFSFSAPRL
jgi:hypothetical protein